MPETLKTVLTSFEFEACIRLILGAILAGIIGYERQAWKKPAGMRTHILVGESAVLIMLCGIYLSHKTGNADPSRIPAQLLSGIGFIGAGTILRDGFQVKGLTTAASLLAVTGIGLIIGAGSYIVGIIATLLVYIILSYTYVVSDSSEKYNEFKFKIYPKEEKIKIEDIEKIFNNDEILLKSMKDGEEYIEVNGKILDSINKNKLMTSIMKVEEVKEVIEE